MLRAKISDSSTSAALYRDDFVSTHETPLLKLHIGINAYISISAHFILRTLKLSWFRVLEGLEITV